MQQPALPKAAAPQSRIAAALPLATALAATLVLIAPVLSPHLQLYYRDTARLYYPVKQYIAERLSHGQLPLWDPWTECGLSLLGQISPGLFHPFTLLYLLLPFDLAFKLNHLLALPLAAAGAYWLSRKLGTTPWPSAVAGVIYGCSGYLVSTTASNLPYALGPASIPAACAGLLWLCERPSAKRLLSSALLLALCNYSGEPQSALLAAAIGGVCALGMALGGERVELRARLRKGLRAAGLTALWAGLALAISMPAVLPGGLRAHASNRWHGLSAEERALFSVHPARLLGLAIPRAFDDTVDAVRASRLITPYWEYLAIADRASFADAIGLGMPAMLLALFALFSDRRGRALWLGALVFALASTGEALGVHAVLNHLIPGLGLFRYSEKLIAPASLLIALAAARSAETALSTTRSAALWLCGLCGAAAASLFGLRLWIRAHEPRVLEWLLVRGAQHLRPPAVDMLRLLEPALATSAALALALGLIALHRALARRAAGLAPALAAACCFAAAMTSASDLLFATNVALFHTQPKLAEELVRRAGPSEGRWRFFSSAEPHASSGNLYDLRIGATVSEMDSLAPQLEALFHIESSASYFSLLDDTYLAGMGLATRNLNTVFDVRFVSTGREQMSARQAKETGFQPVLDDFWLRENPPRPRAFLVARVFLAPAQGDFAVMADPAFDPTQAALVDRGERAQVGKVDGPGPVGDAAMTRVSPEKIDVAVEAPARRLLLIAEHFDPGWRATLDGAPAPLLRADLAAMAVPVPPGKHAVKLRFWPVGLTPGIWIAAAALLAMAIAIGAERAGRQIPSAD